MTSRDISIKNSVGLHARPATFFIQKANRLLGDDSLLYYFITSTICVGNPQQQFLVYSLKTI